MDWEASALFAKNTFLVFGTTKHIAATTTPAEKSGTGEEPALFAKNIVIVSGTTKHINATIILSVEKHHPASIVEKR